MVATELLIPDDVVAYYEGAEGDVYDGSAARMLFLIRALAQRINDVSTMWLEPFGLSALSYHVLARLQAAPTHSITLSALTRSLHTRAQTITSLINALEGDGLVRRIAHETDRRATLAKLTPKGLRIAAKATRSQHHLITASMRGISAVDRTIVLAVLAEIGETLNLEKARRGRIETVP